MQFLLSEKNFDLVGMQTHAAFLGKNKEIIDVFASLKKDPKFINSHVYKQELKQLEELYKSRFEIHYNQVKKKTTNELAMEFYATSWATSLGLIFGLVGVILWVIGSAVPITAPLLFPIAFVFMWLSMVSYVATAVEMYKTGVQVAAS